MSTYYGPSTGTPPSSYAFALMATAIASLAPSSLHVERREHGPPEQEINNDRVWPAVHPAEPLRIQNSSSVIHCVYFWLWQPLKCAPRLPDSFELKPASCSHVSQPVI